jgi:FkbM family methyltransferase
MTIRQRLNSIIKHLLARILSVFGITILSKSDFSKNGLQPFLKEFLMRQSYGILHIGAHHGQEALFYERLNLPVLWVEADPNSYAKLKRNVINFPNQTCRNFIAHSICAVNSEFHIASNNGESSSIFPIAVNDYWEGLENVGVTYLPAMKVDCAISRAEIEKYSYWVIDVQGAELEVLRGSLKSLKSCRYLNLEVSQGTFYKGGAHYSDLKQFLENLGFFPIWDPSDVHEEIVFHNSNYQRL